MKVHLSLGLFKAFGYNFRIKASWFRLDQWCSEYFEEIKLFSSPGRLHTRVADVYS